MAVQSADPGEDNDDPTMKNPPANPEGKDTEGEDKAEVDAGPKPPAATTTTTSETSAGSPL